MYRQRCYLMFPQFFPAFSQKPQNCQNCTNLNDSNWKKPSTSSHPYFSFWWGLHISPPKKNFQTTNLPGSKTTNHHASRNEFSPHLQAQLQLPRHRRQRQLHAQESPRGRGGRLAAVAATAAQPEGSPTDNGGQRSRWWGNWREGKPSGVAESEVNQPF